MKISLWNCLQCTAVCALVLYAVLLPSGLSEASFLNGVTLLILAQIATLRDIRQSVVLGMGMILILNACRTGLCQEYFLISWAQGLAELFEKPQVGVSPPLTETDFTRFQTRVVVMQISLAFAMALPGPLTYLAIRRWRFTKNN